MIKLCSNCRVEIVGPRATKANAKYCSHACCVTVKGKKKTRRMRRVKIKKVILYSCYCHNCSVPVTGTSNQMAVRKYCSTSCRNAAINSIPRKNMYEDRACAECKSIFKSCGKSKGRHYNQTYCSNACRFKHRRAKMEKAKILNREAAKLQREHATQATMFAKLGKRFRECKMCKVQYSVINFSTSIPHNLCSLECHGKFYGRAPIKWKRSRMQELARRSAAVDPIIVFAVQRWTCQLCGVKTPKELVGDSKALDAPTLDHVIPLSKGGAHDYENVQCLCRSCNSIKSDRIVAPGMRFAG